MLKKNLELVFNNNGNLNYTKIKFYLYQLIYQELNFHLIRKSMILEKRKSKPKQREKNWI